MTLRYYTFLLILGLSGALLLSAFQPAPGYMDADYYFATAMRIAGGKGFSEPFLWNYLDNPQGLPHPSHAYWMPLTSLLAAAGMRIWGTFSFLAARSGFLLLAGVMPPLTAALSYRLNRDRFLATLSGLLAVFPVFYAPFLAVTDTFAIYMLLGVLFFLLLSPSPSSPISHAPPAHPASYSPAPLLPPHFSAPQLPRFFLPLLLGLIAGLMHLSRADGLLWVLVAMLAGLKRTPPAPRTPHPAPRTSHFASRIPNLVPRTSHLASRILHLASLSALILSGYFLFMASWLIRNQHVFGTPLAPGGARALWLTSYDELFAYPAELLTFSHWWASGIGAILRARLWALGQNLQTALAVQAGIFLLPLILLGAWHHRCDLRVRIGALAWTLTLAAMTLAFPFAGARGGFFHSGAALQPLLWALAPMGLDRFVAWGTRTRGWKKRQARLVFGSAMIGLTVVLSIFIVGQRVLGWGSGHQTWGSSQQNYVHLEKELQALGASQNDLVMVNNPPGYFLASGRRAIVIPDGDAQTLLAAAERYQADYILLEENHPRGLDQLYRHPKSYPQFQLLWSDDLVHILRVETNP